MNKMTLADWIWEKKLIKKYSPKLNKTHNENKVTSIDDYREAV